MKQESALTDYKNFCPICNAPDDDDTWCRCDYPTQANLRQLLRTIYADKSTPERIKTLIEAVFRP